tara:strand:- start:446 stop:1111 length:666 start_codon:yes stop_codon:yes gene_type:complete
MMRFKENNYNKLFVSVSDFIRLICGGDRLKRITNIIDDLLKKEYLKKNKRLKILDYGCGSMEISKKLEEKNYIKSIVGTDIFNHSYKSKKLTYINNRRLFKENEKFDVIFVVDVLHHMGINNTHKVLNKLSKLSKIIIVKDHFEHGFFSRQLLRFVDFYANYGYGVNVPKKYFNKNRWKKILIKSNSKEIFRKNSFQQHDGLFNLILNKKHHFVSMIKVYE